MVSNFMNINELVRFAIEIKKSTRSQEKCDQLLKYEKNLSCLGQSVQIETVPSVLNMDLGRMIKTSGTVFLYTDLPAGACKLIGLAVCIFTGWPI